MYTDVYIEVGLDVTYAEMPLSFYESRLSAVS